MWKLNPMIFVLLTLAFIAFLLYRIIDVSVSLHYSQESISQLSSDYEVVLRYHRTRCDDFNEADEKSFKKEGNLVISGVTFLCEKDDEGIFRLLVK